MNKTGFQIDCLKEQIIITHVNMKAVFLVNFDNRDYITFVETICSNKTVISLLVILKGTVLLEKHFKNNMNDNTLMIITSTDYINNTLSLL